MSTVDPGNRGPGFDPPFSVNRGMAVKTEPADPLNAFRLFLAGQAVAGHTGLILGRQLGEDRLFLVACGTLLPSGFGRIEFTDAVVAEAWLSVGFMAADTVFVFFPFLGRPGTVNPLIQAVLNLVMTHQAVVGFEERGTPFVDVSRIGVGIREIDLIVAVDAGGLPVGRYVKGLFIDQPCGLGIHRQQSDDGRYYEDQNGFFHDDMEKHASFDFSDPYPRFNRRISNKEYPMSK
jgi:hypothetical protein